MFFNLPFGGLIPGAKGAVLEVLLNTQKPMTGRHVSLMVGESYSLWAVQQALKDLEAMGLVEAQSYGRSRLHQLNDRHVNIPSLRAMAYPVEVLRRVVQQASAGAHAVILFGSIARGEASADSDVDLAVIAPKDWDGAHTLQDAVWEELGSNCDVLVFTPAEFCVKERIEPVVSSILRDGVALVGLMPKSAQEAS
ncbi:MAG: nucleotidyltransferase domain-containing protein [Propionibacteriaceae bacterium]|nr:nucleotidyltransferase domain-containing protein [Propionibacteriaceae bacterium]